MAVADATTAQGMATRHRRSVKAVVAGLGEINALLAKIIKGNRIKWGGYGTHAVWYVRKLKETSDWVTGQLGSRSFEEKDPMDEATVPYCFIDETYGVSEKSIKTNRAAGSEKLYDIQKENARNAQTALYRAIAKSFYTNGTNALAPVGLRAICARPIEDTNEIQTYNGVASYAGIQLQASQISTWADNYSSMGWSNEYWFPTAISITQIPTNSGSKWSSDAHLYLPWMAHKMSRTADKSGTGKIIKPDMALMSSDPWGSLAALMTKSQKDTSGVPLGTKDPDLGDFSTIRVGGLDCVYDDNVPLDTLDGGSGYEMIFIVDSKAFYLDSLNKKSEGLIEGQWKQDDPEIVGGVGMYKANMALICETPLSVGVVVGCND